MGGKKGCNGGKNHHPQNCFTSELLFRGRDKRLWFVEEPYKREFYRRFGKTGLNQDQISSLHEKETKILETGYFERLRSRDWAYSSHDITADILNREANIDFLTLSELVLVMEHSLGEALYNNQNPYEKFDELTRICHEQIFSRFEDVGVSIKPPVRMFAQNEIILRNFLKDGKYPAWTRESTKPVLYNELWGRWGGPWGK